VQQALLVDDADGSNYGDSVLDWDHATATTLDGVFVSPVAEPEQLAAGRDTVITRWRLQVPLDAAEGLPAGALQATDRVVYDGKTYEVDGQPERWPSPTGTMDHVDAFLVLTEG
jgi:hypothetical protein